MFALCLVSESSNWLQLHYCIMQNSWSLKDLLEDSSDPRVTVTRATLWMDVNLCSKSPYWAQQGSLSWWWTTFPCKCKPLSLSSLQLSSLSIRRGGDICHSEAGHARRLQIGPADRSSGNSLWVLLQCGKVRREQGLVQHCTVTRCSNPLGALLSRRTTNKVIALYVWATWTETSSFHIHT